ncbi:nitroreductase [Leptothrix discophora]|uniref:Nitroreductase n=1 Tax=Leptothrix discophora TaxID=89 RepID=A0ABT9G8I9_LEPDI|nr:nitroreductase [Leptothrix discophora]MDP4302612.1 nitroreductase [Leptothrix discophora]
MPVVTALDTLRQRRSIRAFLPTPVADEQLFDLLRIARQAPSGANLQPGEFIAVRGAARERLGERLTQAWRDGEPAREDYSYFPQPMPKLLRRRQVAAAQALYGAIGVGREDRAGRDAQFARNFRFFDAPVALIVTIDRRVGTGCYMDLGMALYGLMLAAEAQGLASCAIGAMASWPDLIRAELGLDDDTAIVCGMAIGHADPDAPVNRTVTAREPLESFFRVVG